VPKVASKKILFARGIHCCPNFFSLSLTIHEGVEVVYDYHYYQMMPRLNNFYTSQKLREVTGYLNRLPKNSLNYFVLYL
jgi:hypothetical protein